MGRFSFLSCYLVVNVFILAGCHSSDIIKSGEKAFQYKQYAYSIPLLQNEFKEAKDIQQKSSIAYMLGECYRNIGRYDEALPWFKKSTNLGFGALADSKLASMLKCNEEYEDAILVYQKMMNEYGSDDNVRKEIKYCKLASEWKRSAMKIGSIEVMPFDILNEPTAHDFGPSIDSIGNIYFSSDRMDVTGQDKYYWSGAKFFDILMYNTSNGSVVNPGLPLNTENHEGSPCVTSKFEIFYTSCLRSKRGHSFCSIYSYNLKGGSDPVSLDLGNESCNNMHPALHYMDTIMVFSSDRGNGYGGYDLYYTKRVDDRWTSPINLGPTINTEGNEKFPTWNKDTLYFSSDFLPGMGGLDLFKSWIGKEGNWVNPQNLKYPINSGYDDYSLIHFPGEYLGLAGNKKLICSNRLQKIGDKIFLVDDRTSIQKVPDSSGIINLAKISYFVYFDFRESEQYHQPLNIKPLDSILVLNENTIINSPSEKSYFILEPIPDSTYSLKFSRRGYWNALCDYKVEIPVGPFEKDTSFTFRKSIELVPIIYNKSFVLKDVYFDFDRWDIRNDAKKSLDELATFMNTNYSVKLEIDSHTDCRGESAYNLNLSIKRAESVVQYLISKGIDSVRLISKGSGESDPSVPCNCSLCTEEEHQLNRRSTFTVISG